MLHHMECSNDGFGIGRFFRYFIYHEIYFRNVPSGIDSLFIDNPWWLLSCQLEINCQFNPKLWSVYRLSSLLIFNHSNRSQWMEINFLPDGWNRSRNRCCHPSFYKRTYKRREYWNIGYRWRKWWVSGRWSWWGWNIDFVREAKVTTTADFAPCVSRCSQIYVQEWALEIGWLRTSKKKIDA